jgi:threonine/homoserine/homoserine lactone efflux protein
MTLQEFTALLILATAMSFTPGPNTTLSTALAANFGLKRAMPFVCAVPVGWGLLISACALGLGPLVQTVPALHWGIKIIGCGYLLWLAIKLWQTNRLTQANQAQLNVGFTQGVALQFINIKAWMLALTITGGWVIGKPEAGMRFAMVLPVMMCYAFCSNLTYAAVGSVLREWLSVGSRLNHFNRLMSVVLSLTSVWMFSS